MISLVEVTINVIAAVAAGGSYGLQAINSSVKDALVVNGGVGLVKGQTGIHNKFFTVAWTL